MVQEIETFCLSGAQTDIAAAVGDASLFATAGWQHLRAVLGIKEEETLSGLCVRSSCKAVVVAAEISMFGNPLSSYSEDFVEDDPSLPMDEEAAATRFVNEWMGAILDTTWGLILSQLCKIKKITRRGCIQLEADLGYLR